MADPAAVDRAPTAEPSPGLGPVVPAGGPFAALAYPGIRLIIFGTFFAFSGYWVFFVAQGWMVLELTDSPALVGLVSAFSQFPFLVFSFVGGVLADRVDRKKVSLASRGFVVTVMLLEAILVWTGAIEIWMMMLLALGAGVGFSMDNPVRQSMVPDLVEPEHLPNAIALTLASGNLCNIVGPSLGGVLLAGAGPGWAFFATAAGNGILFGSYVALRLPHRARQRSAGVVRQLRQGVAWVRRDEVFFILVVAAAISGLVQPYQTMMPVFARDELGLGSEGLGVMSAAPGLGALVGSLSVAVLGAAARKGRLMFLGAFMAASALIVFTFAPTLHVALPLLFVIGLSNAFFLTMNNTIVMQRAPAELRGRVISMMVVVWGLSPIGASIAGLVATATDVRIALAAGGALALLTTSVVFARRPTLRAI